MIQQQPTLEQRIALLQHQHAEAQRTYKQAEATMYRIEGQIAAFQHVLEEQLQRHEAECLRLEEEQRRLEAEKLKSEEDLRILEEKQRALEEASKFPIIGPANEALEEEVEVSLN